MTVSLGIFLVFLLPILLSGRFLRGNFFKNFLGSRVKKIIGKKTFLTRKFFRKISSPKISSGKKNSNAPSRGNFLSQEFPGDKRKFLDYLIIELKSVQDEAHPFPVLDDAYCCTYTRLYSLLYVHTTLFSAVLTHASSHTNVSPRALTNVRGRTAVLAGMIIDFFVFSPGSLRRG